MIAVTFSQGLSFIFQASPLPSSDHNFQWLCFILVAGALETKYLGVTNWFDLMNELRLIGKVFLWGQHRRLTRTARGRLRISVGEMGSPADVCCGQPVACFQNLSSSALLLSRKRMEGPGRWNDLPKVTFSDWARTGLLLSLIAPAMMSHKRIGRGWICMGCDFRDIRKSLM